MKRVFRNGFLILCLCFAPFGAYAQVNLAEELPRLASQCRNAPSSCGAITRDILARIKAVAAARGLTVDEINAQVGAVIATVTSVGVGTSGTVAQQIADAIRLGADPVVGYEISTLAGRRQAATAITVADSIQTGRDLQDTVVARLASGN